MGRLNITRCWYKDLSISVRAALLKRGLTLTKELEKQLEPPDETTLKIHTLHSIVDRGRFAPHFENKDWLLFETTRDDPLFISDSPVVLDNEVNHRSYGNIGLAVKGIQIYVPLSSTLCLALFCPSILEALDQAIVRLEIQLRHRPQPASLKDSRAFLDRAKSGAPIKLEPANVERLNSLQVKMSHRFVFCEMNSFKLVDRMLDKHPHFKTGPKHTVD